MVDGGDDFSCVFEVSCEELFGDGLLGVLAAVSDLSHAVERPDVGAGWSGCEGCFGVEADGVVGSGPIGCPVSVRLHVGGDRLARRVVERHVGQGGIGVGQRG